MALFLSTAIGLSNILGFSTIKSNVLLSFSNNNVKLFSLNNLSFFLIKSLGLKFNFLAI